MNKLTGFFNTVKEYTDEEHLTLVLKTLKELRDTYDMDCYKKMSICGLLQEIYYLHYVHEVVEARYHLLLLSMKGWEGYSDRLKRFPVYTSKSLDPRQEYLQAQRLGGMWTGDYGESRLSLLDYIISGLEGCSGAPKVVLFCDNFTVYIKEKN